MTTLLVGAGVGALACMISAAASAQDANQDPQKPDALPDPLTLEAALAHAPTTHPDLAEAQAQLAEARAAREAAMVSNAPQLDLEATARYADPSVNRDDTDKDLSRNDSSVELRLTKELYDFGRRDARLAATEARIAGQELRYVDTRREHRIHIMKRFFEVILADLRYARDNEAMAVAYVRFDRLRDRSELGQVSDVDLLEAENQYQRRREQRYASDAERRTARARLARALNRPEQLPSDLEQPALPGIERERPDLAELTERALSHNPRLRALRAESEAAQQRLARARAGDNPTLRGEVSAGEYSRDLGSNNDLAAGVTLEVPLYRGGQVEAAVARAQARRQRAAARLRRGELDVRQAVRETWERLGVLAAQRQRVQVQRDYRELYLDRSRTLYRLEVRTDLGDAMVRWSEYRLARAKVDFELALAWARLHALTGEPVTPTKPPQPEGDASSQPDEAGEQ